MSIENLTQAKPKSEPEHFTYIDALRGLAISGVFILHSSYYVSDMPARFYKICSFGRFGVQLFFILSALTLLHSFHGRSEDKKTLVRNFYIRRFFRIAPMFWGGVILYNYSGLKPNYFSPEGISWSQILATFAFIHGWYPTYINSVVPGGWSIAVETTFYAIFPLFVIWLFDKRRVLIALVCVLILDNLLNHFLYSRMLPFWQGHRTPVLVCFLNWWFPSQLPVFLIGFLLYYKMRFPKEPTRSVTRNSKRRAFTYIIGAWLLVAILVHGSSHLNALLSKTRSDSLLSAAFAIAFALLVYGLAMVPFRLFVNRFFRYLGLISFSGYIDHFIVLDKTGRLMEGSVRHLHYALYPPLYYTLFCAITVPATIALATVTYYFIEKPGITLGKKLVAYLEARHAAPPLASAR